MNLCDECQPKWLAWLDYRLPPAPIQLMTIGSDSPREMRERREARFRLWRDTIRSQQQIIADICARLHGAPLAVSAWRQGDLLADLLGDAA